MNVKQLFAFVIGIIFISFSDALPRFRRQLGVGLPLPIPGLGGQLGFGGLVLIFLLHLN